MPDGAAPDEALKRTTHLGVGAHQDDLEIMAYHGVLACFGQSEQWFTGAVVTDGRGSPRTDAYADVSDAAMSEVRKVEQKKAAAIGEYAAVVLMNHPSASVKDAANAEIAADLDALLAATLPQVVYTHNLADKHDSHVAVTLRVLAAIRRMKPSARPRKVIGCEVWRDLDWLNDADKVAMPVDDPSPLSDALLAAFDSQIVAASVTISPPGVGDSRTPRSSMGRRPTSTEPSFGGSI